MKKIVLAAVPLLFISFIYPSHASEPIKIAAIFAKTGLASATNDEFDMIHLAVETINTNGGLLGRQIQIIEFDNKSTAIGSKEAGLEAVKQNIVAVIGATWSSHSLAMAPIFQKAKIPMISPMSTSPEVTLIGDYIFRTCFTDPFQGKLMATFAVTDLKAKTAAMLVNAGNDYSLGLARFFKQTALELGMVVTVEESYSGNQVNFSSILKKVKKAAPDVIFVPGYTMDSGLIIKQAKKMGIKGIFMGGDAWSNKMFDYADQNMLEDGYYIGHWYNGVTFLKSKELPDIFFKKYQREMPIYAPLCYDSVLLIANAIEQAGSLDKQLIRDKLAATNNFMVNTGMITFDENRDPLNKDAVIVKFTQGRTQFVKSIKPQK